MSTHFQSCNVNSMDPDGPDATFADLNTARNMIYLLLEIHHKTRWSWVNTPLRRYE